jgi:hypothetical protein
MNFKKLFFAAVIVLSANASFAQGGDTNEASHTVAINIAEVALLDLESSTGTAITLAGTAPTEAGLPMTFEDANDASTWINYSSIVSGESTRNVTVAITDGAVPAGLKLTVLAAPDAGNGAGTVGTENASVITLSLDYQEIISGVGSAYTEDGANNGHKLTYQLGYETGAATDYANLKFDNSDTVTITYTLSEI